MIKATRIGLLIVIFSIALIIGNEKLSTAQVISFEDLYPGYETDAIAIPNGYAGFNWSDTAVGITSNFSPGSGYQYGTQGKVSIYTRWSQPISMLYNKFNFSGAYITAAWDASETVIVEGWRDGALVYSSVITTHNDKAYWFGFNYQNIDTVWFKPQGSQIDIDNITYVAVGPVGYSAGWLIVTIASLLLAGGYLLRRRLSI